MSEYFLGLDLGGSKSLALAADQEGRLAGCARAGPGNPDVIGLRDFQALVRSLVARSLNTAGIDMAQVRAAGFGVAGYDWPSQEPALRQALCAAGVLVPITLVNDTLMGLAAGAEQGWGVAITAGTSCNCRGRDPSGREGRCIGYGLEWGEAAGAYELLRKALQAVGAAYTRRGLPTSLTEIFLQYTGAPSPEDLIEGLVRGCYALPASAAPLVFQAAEGGDEAAQEAVAWAGRQLGDLAVGVIRQLDLQELEFETVLFGSLFNAGRMLIQPLEETVRAEAPRTRLVHLQAPPACGAVLLAMQSLGMDTRPLRPILLRQARALWGPA